MEKRWYKIEIRVNTDPETAKKMLHAAIETAGVDHVGCTRVDEVGGQEKLQQVWLSSQKGRPDST